MNVDVSSDGLLYTWKQLVTGCRVRMFTTSTVHMVSARVKLDSSLLLDLALPCCLEPLLDLWQINSEIDSLNDLNLIYCVISLYDTYVMKL